MPMPWLQARTSSLTLLRPRPGTLSTTLKPRPSQPSQAPYSRKASASQKSSLPGTETPDKSAKPKQTMRMALPKVTHSLLQQETQEQTSASESQCPTSQLPTYTIQL